MPQQQLAGADDGFAGGGGASSGWEVRLGIQQRVRGQGSPGGSAFLFWAPASLQPRAAPERQCLKGGCWYVLRSMIAMA
jgi:hypothetical protein